MNKDLEQFENRNDDWLAKERTYESKVSAWDIDEGKRIKEIHAQTCEARYIKQTHEMIHQGKIKRIKKDKSSILVPIILILIGLSVLRTIFFEDSISLSPIITFIIFISIANTIVNKDKKGEK